MAHWIVMRRDAEGDVHKVAGLWEADNEQDAIAQMLRKSGDADSGNWFAEPADKREDMMNWHLDKESIGRPESSDKIDEREGHEPP